MKKVESEPFDQNQSVGSSAPARTIASNTIPAICHRLA
jgi:hypothetical protein